MLAVVIKLSQNQELEVMEGRYLGQDSEVATKCGIPWLALFLCKAWAMKLQIYGRPSLEGSGNHMTDDFQTRLLRILGSSSESVGTLPHRVL